MKSRHLVTIISLVFVLIISVTGVFAQRPRFRQPYSNYPEAGLNTQNRKPPRDPKPVPSGICTNGQYLYILDGKVIHQYTLDNLTLMNTVEIPAPEPPTDITPSQRGKQNFEAGQGPRGRKPHPGPGPSGFCTTGQSLYVMQGKSIYQYTLNDLTLMNTAELPTPEPPEEAPEENNDSLSQTE